MPDSRGAVFEATVDQAMGPMLVVDLDGRVSIVTPCMCKMLGLKQADLGRGSACRSPSAPTRRLVRTVDTLLAQGFRGHPTALAA
jgi:hypothetical protein